MTDLNGQRIVSKLDSDGTLTVSLEDFTLPSLTDGKW